VFFNETVYGSVAEFTCNDGYNLTDGDEMVTCDEDGKWNGTIPICRKGFLALVLTNVQNTIRHICFDFFTLFEKMYERMIVF
jgi:hypothetical protein